MVEAMSVAAAERSISAETRTSLNRLHTLVMRSATELNELRAREDESPVAERLSQWIYERWYTRLDSITPSPAGLEQRSMVPALRVAMERACAWEDGWVVLGVRGHGCIATRNGTTRLFVAGDYANVSRPGVPPAPGDRITAIDRLDWLDGAGVFWAAGSTSARPENPLVRVYWSVDPSNAGTALEHLVAGLNASGARWSLKCPVRAEGFARPDSLVVYIEEGAWKTLAQRIRALARTLRSHLRKPTPPLTRRIAHGVAFAEDSQDGRSFGQTRCDALAPAVAILLERCPLPSEEAIATLTESMSAHGIDPTRPWKCRR